MMRFNLVFILLMVLLGTGCASGPKPSISSAEPELRLKALMELDQRGELPQHLAIVTELVTDDHDSLVRALAISYLGKYRYSKGIPALVKVLHDKEDIVREALAKALGVLRAEEAVKLLIEVLEDDSSSMVRRAVAEALGEIGNPEALDGLMKHLEDIEPSVAYAALKALQKITKQSLGKNMEAWRKWLGEQKQ